ncbi:MAG: NTP transferase domain-containing protein [Chloroflexota bacterium]
MNVTAIILAAGTSSRMGRPKQLLQFEGKSLVRRAAEAAVRSRTRHTIVVTGAARTDVEGELAGLAVRIVHNPEYADGMSTSLRAGIQAVRPEIDAAVVMLADQPFITDAVVNQLIDLYDRTGAKIVRPRYGGVPGNPVLWDRSLFHELMQQTGDQGGRALLQEYRDQIAWLELPDATLQTDVDTPEAYATLTGAAGLEAESPSAPAGTTSPTAAPPTPAGTHPHAGGFKFCPRCATPLVMRPITYDANKVHPACPNCNFVVWHDPKVAVLTVVPWEGGILLGKRNQNPGKGKWSFPSGFVDRGEVVEDAARRETREETGLDIDITGLVGVYSSPGNAVIVIAYAATVRGGTLQADDDLSELAAFDPADLPEMAFAHDERIIRDWQALVSRSHEQPTEVS